MSCPLPLARLCCSAARQNNELRMVAMTVCLCHGGVCELSIRCSWPWHPMFSTILRRPRTWHTCSHCKYGFVGPQTRHKANANACGCCCFVEDGAEYRLFICVVPVHGCCFLCFPGDSEHDLVLVPGLQLFLFVSPVAQCFCLAGPGCCHPLAKRPTFKTGVLLPMCNVSAVQG